MAEIDSIVYNLLNPDPATLESIVHNLLNPGPATLQKLSANAFAIQFWRWHINNHRTEDNLARFYPEEIFLPLTQLELKIPPVIYNFIKQNLKRFGLSLRQWRHEHWHYKQTNATFLNIFNFFDDFACDNNSVIHNVRTAKRMMLCDRISLAQKFQIACEYCFEDEIRQIWPSVSDTIIDLSVVSFQNRPLEYYWICQLTNQMTRIPSYHNLRYGYPFSIDEMMLDKCPTHAWSSFHYFWNRLSLESQWKMALRMFDNRKLVFAKVILPMLSEEQLQRFMNAKSADWIFDLCLEASNDEWQRLLLFDDTDTQMCILSTWMYIRSKVDQENFTKMVEKMLDTETNKHFVKDALDDNDKRCSYKKSWSTLDRDVAIKKICFCEVWSSASPNLKSVAVERILCGKRLCHGGNYTPFEARDTCFLVKLLSVATMETKRMFWDKNWPYLMAATRLQDFQQIMELCFDCENEINCFKVNVLSIHKNIDRYCSALFRKSCFKKLDSFLIFCCPETQKRKCLKRRFLESNFRDGNCIFSIDAHLEEYSAINDFIDDAYESENLATEFKNRLVSIPSFQNDLVRFVCSANFYKLMNFVDNFVLMDEIRVKLKQHFMEILKSNLLDGIQCLSKTCEFQDFVMWCLGDAEEVIKFKQSISPVELLRNIARDEIRSLNLDGFGFNIFLEWYFNTAKEAEQFKTKHSELIKKLNSKKSRRCQFRNTPVPAVPVLTPLHQRFRNTPMPAVPVLTPLHPSTL